MGRIKSPRPGYPDLVHPRDFAADAGFSEDHYYKLVKQGKAPETCGGIPRKIATAWLRRRAAAALKAKQKKAAHAVALAQDPIYLDEASAREQFRLNDAQLEWLRRGEVISIRRLGETKLTLIKLKAALQQEVSTGGAS